DERRAIGVNEVACLVDFGVPTRSVLDPLVHFDRLRALASDVAASAPVDHSIAALVRRHGATHLQCTPSMARMLLDGGDVSALGSLRCWMVGGEALTPELVRDIRAVTSAEL